MPRQLLCLDIFLPQMSLSENDPVPNKKDWVSFCKDLHRTFVYVIYWVHNTHVHEGYYRYSVLYILRSEEMQFL